jgi:hypothetical protein
LPFFTNQELCKHHPVRAHQIIGRASVTGEFLARMRRIAVDGRTGIGLPREEPRGSTGSIAIKSPMSHSGWTEDSDMHMARSGHSGFKNGAGFMRGGSRSRNVRLLFSDGDVW